MHSSDEIYQVLRNQAMLKSGNLWNDMNDKERNTAMLKVAIVLITTLTQESEK